MESQSDMAGCRPLSAGEKEIILKAFKGKHSLRNLALFVMGIKSGFRVSELLSLKVRDVYKDGACLEYVHVASSHMKGKKKARSILMHPDVKKALQAYLLANQLEEDDFLFKSQGRNKAISRMQAHEILKKAYADCEMIGKLATHSMRKTFATDMYNALGKDLLKLQKAMGHDKIDNTVKYLAVEQSDIEEALLQI